MAKRRRKAPPTPNRRAMPLRSPRPFKPLQPVRLGVRRAPVSPLRLYEDRRTYHPLKAARAAFSSPRRAAHLVVGRPTPKVSFPSVVRFADPRKVLICVRRAARARIMHATGAAGGKVRKPKRRFYSGVSCK